MCVKCAHTEGERERESEGGKEEKSVDKVVIVTLQFISFRAFAHKFYQFCDMCQTMRRVT